MEIRLQHHGRADIFTAFSKAMEIIENPTCSMCGARILPYDRHPKYTDMHVNCVHELRCEDYTQREEREEF